jgi:hypothetical protein
LLDPRDVPRRRPGSAKGRRAILHAVAHIELNAVDLHWDVIARFSHVPMPIGFFDDWVRAADEESKHFNLVADVLDVMDCPYGSPSRPCRDVARRRGHRGRPDGAAGRGAHGAGGARPRRDAGYDRDLPQGHDRPEDGAAAAQAVAAMEVIYAEEVHHVAYGSKWFHFLCGRENLDPKPAFHDLVRAISTARSNRPSTRKTRRSGAAAGFLLAAGGGAACAAMTRPQAACAERLRSAPGGRRNLAQILSKWLSDRLRQGSVLRQGSSCPIPRGA